MVNESQNKLLLKQLDDCLTLADLHNVFSLQELVILTQNGILEDWLNNHLFEIQAEILSSVCSGGVDTILLTLCSILNVDVVKLSDYEAGLVSQALQREQERKMRERNCGKDGRIVTNQMELVEALSDEDIRKVYLCNNKFSIPLNRGHITYDGRGNAIINILTQGQGDNVLNFDRNEVYFYNLTIVFHFLESRQVKIAHSSQNHNHFIFLNENRIVQDDSVRSSEMEAFLSGRNHFESAGDFAERAKRFKGVIVGKVYLNDMDYDLWHEAFFLNPIWRIEFIDSLRRYIQGAKLVFRVDCEKAKELYEHERVQLVYADFGTDKDNTVITRIYLQPENGHGDVYPLYCLRDTTSWTFSSGSGESGYGLDLIAVDSNNRHKSNVVSYD